MGLPRTALLLFLLLFGAAQAAPDGPGPGRAPYACSGGSAGACLRKAGHAPRSGGRWTDERLADTLTTRAGNTAPCSTTAAAPLAAAEATAATAAAPLAAAAVVVATAAAVVVGRSRRNPDRAPLDFGALNAHGTTDVARVAPAAAMDRSRHNTAAHVVARGAAAPAAQEVVRAADTAASSPAARADQLDVQHGPHQRRVRVPRPL